MDRRTYLKLGGATVAATGMIVGGACVMDRRDEPDEPPDEPEDEPPAEPPDDADERLDPDEFDGERIAIDYDRYATPAEVYRVWTGNPSSFSFVDGPTHSGETALQCVVSAGDSWGSNAAYWFPENGHGQPTSVYQRAMVYLDEGWQMNDDDVCRLWSPGLNTESGGQGSGGRGVPSGDDGWSSALAVANRDTADEESYNLATYTYHVDQPTDSGELEILDAPVRTGEWIQLETHVRLNTMQESVANRDGAVRIWLDGDLAYERMDFRWSARPEQAIEYAGPLVRYGGGETAPTDLAVFYDEHELHLDWEPPELPTDGEQTLEDPSNVEAYDERLTIRNGPEATRYSVVVDERIVQSDWSQATYNDSVSVTTEEVATLEATAVPHTVDGYFFDGELLAFSASAEPLEVWLSGEEISVEDYPDTP